MKLGLIGLENSGKTTIFNALTKADAEVTSYATSKVEPNIAMVDVIDDRITKLSDIYQPKKTIYANIEFTDFVGLSQGSAKNGLFSGNALALIKNTDALGVVIRNFEDELMDANNPVEDLQQIDDELKLADLIIAENRLEKIKLAFKRGQKTSALLVEEKVIIKIIEALNENIPIRDIGLEEVEEKSVRGFQFLSQKSLMVILNSGEDNFNKNSDVINEIKELGYQVIEFAGKFEMELAFMDDEEVEMFMDDMGIEESAKDRLTKFAYNLLGYISFFTVGKDEVRAWTIKNGDNAVTAAGAIHSDLARGFIRAECFNYTDFIECGSEKVIKEKGKFRLEGKEYKVKDGDILSIRFSV